VALAVGAPARRRPGARRADRAAAVVVWTPGAGEQRCVGHRDTVTAVAWADGGHVLSGAWDGTVRLWDAADCRPRATIAGFGLLVRDLAVAASGRWAAVAGWAARLDAPATAVLALLYGGAG